MALVDVYKMRVRVILDSLFVMFDGDVDVIIELEEVMIDVMFVFSGGECA